MKKEEVTEHGLVPPLTFRLYQTIRFNRPIDRERDHISPGGYELVMRDADSTEKTIQFDFEDSEGSVNDKDPYTADFMQKNPMYGEFPELNNVTEHMLRNIVAVKDWYVYTEGTDDNDTPLLPVKVENAKFEIINDSTGSDIPAISIPIPVPIELAVQ